MRWSLGLVIALAGCQSLLGIDEFHTAGDAGPEADAATDAASDAELDAPSDSLTCFGALKSICFTSPPSGTINLSGTISTTTDVRCVNYPQSGGPDLCVISGATVNVATTSVQGNRPLVLVAMTTITVSGELDASSSAVGTVGAGANSAGCSVTTGGTQSSGGGGGGGGGLGAVGGGGGKGSSGGLAGPGGAVTTISQIRGGCPGGKGGDGSLNSGGSAGAGGGSLTLLAGSSISVAAAGGLYASGAGGGLGGVAGANRGAGGGGGSGGLIVLDAPSITVAGTVAANGGGGGGGADLGVGNNGDDGKKANYNIFASGGQNEGASHGGRGGDGGVLGTAASAGELPGNGGGGGGGGGVGVVWLHGTLTGTRVSPTPQVH